MTVIAFSMQKATGRSHIAALLKNISPAIIQQQKQKLKKEILTMFHILSDTEPSFYST